MLPNLSPYSRHFDKSKMSRDHENTTRSACYIRWVVRMASGAQQRNIVERQKVDHNTEIRKTLIRNTFVICVLFFAQWELRYVNAYVECIHRDSNVRTLQT